MISEDQRVWFRSVQNLGAADEKTDLVYVWS